MTTAEEFEGLVVDTLIAYHEGDDERSKAALRALLRAAVEDGSRWVWMHIYLAKFASQAFTKGSGPGLYIPAVYAADGTPVAVYAADGTPVAIQDAPPDVRFVAQIIAAVENEDWTLAANLVVAADSDKASTLALFKAALAGVREVAK